jgi:hypothetical protein
MKVNKMQEEINLAKKIRLRYLEDIMEDGSLKPILQEQYLKLKKERIKDA